MARALRRVLDRGARLRSPGGTPRGTAIRAGARPRRGPGARGLGDASLAGRGDPPECGHRSLDRILRPVRPPRRAALHAIARGVSRASAGVRGRARGLPRRGLLPRAGAGSRRRSTRWEGFSSCTRSFAGARIGGRFRSSARGSGSCDWAWSRGGQRRRWGSRRSRRPGSRLRGLRLESPSHRSGA